MGGGVVQRIEEAERVSRNAVISGLGILSPIGNNLPEFWQALCEGQNGVGPLRPFDNFAPEDYSCRVAAQVDVDPKGMLERDYWSFDRSAQLALLASRQATADAGLDLEREDPYKIAVIAGSGMGGMVFGERELHKLNEKRNPRRVHPTLIAGTTLNAVSGAISLDTGAKGVNLTISTACSSSGHALGQALIQIRTGRADVVIVAGTEASLTPLVFAGFCSMRAMSTSFNDSPERASRPFDRDRDGFVMGEGAACLVVEAEEHARDRGARVYARLAGYGAGGEAQHMVIPDPSGAEVAHVMKLALDDARVAPDEVDLLAAHATSTPAGDLAEVAGIRRLFDSHADSLRVAANKSTVGHTIGASGAISALCAAMSLHTEVTHPTLNLDNLDPECALVGISSTAVHRPFAAALVNSFGFGGNNASLVLCRYPETRL